MFRKYGRNESGQIAIITSLAITGLLIAAGVAIDYSSMSNKRVQLQGYADAAVLAAAISGEQRRNKLQDIATETVNSMITEGDYPTATLSILDDNSMRVEVYEDHPMFIMSAFNHKSKKIAASAEAPPKGDKKMNVALVLDTTDSMAGSKMDTLKTAANNLIDRLDSDGNESSENVLFSVVPFSRYVALPMSMEGQSWLEVEPDNYTCWEVIDLDNSENCYKVDREGEYYECDVKVMKEVCEIVSWYGCVTSRPAPYHTRPEVGVTPIPGFAGGGSCYSDLVPLSANLDEVSAHIDDLRTGDQTYIPAGLMWGWRSLTKQAPLTEAQRNDSDERDNVMILMTDGENSRSHGGTKEGFPGVFHYESDIEAANALTALTCEQIKLDGIEIYTVAFEVTDSVTQTLLQNCASSPNNYYNASNAGSLLSAFNQIGNQLAAVRLSR